MIIYNKLSLYKNINNKYYRTLDEIENKNELIEVLKEKVPYIFKDGQVDLNALKQELNLLDENYDPNEKYGLYWKGKLESRYKANEKSNKTLIPQRDKSLNFDGSDNIIIEGDNLEVLKLFQASYSNKVDVIYIDPPYNTGNDFIYNDNFKEGSLEYKIQNGLVDDEGSKMTTNQKSDGRFHTNWLQMMYPRLILARKLLKDDGIIFISIDDNEQARLKIMCDEIFGEQNFVGPIIWRKKNTGGGSDKITIEIETEYILCYTKNNKFIKFNSQPIDLEKYTLVDEFVDERGKYNLIDLDHVSSTSTFQYLESLDYEIQAPDGTWFKNYRNILKPKSYRYTLGKELFDFCNENNFIEIKKTKEGYWKACRKSYAKVVIDRKNKKIIPRIHGNSYNNLIDKSNITTSSGKRELIKLIQNKEFSFPKPYQLIKYLINLNPNKNSLVLDFFAGSGTTGQAVMELNKEDEGNRKYVLVQLPEIVNNSEEFETICDITRERIKRSIEMYDYKEKGFKSFKLVDSNFKVNQLSNQDTIENIQLSLNSSINKVKKTEKVENLIYEIILRIGLSLNIKINKEIVNNNEIYYNENKTYLFILKPTNNSNYYENIIEVVKHIHNDYSKLNIYLNDQYFKSDEDKINFIEQVHLIKKDIEIWVV